MLMLMLKFYRIVARRYKTKLGGVKAQETLADTIEAVTYGSERHIECATDLWLTCQPDYGSFRCTSIWWQRCRGAA